MGSIKRSHSTRVKAKTVGAGEKSKTVQNDEDNFKQA